MRSKNVGKKTYEKSANNVFLYSHEYRAEKIGGKKRGGKLFSRSNRIMRAKNVGEKYRRKKVRKPFFYIHTNIVNKEWGDKMSETIFPETHE